MSQLYFSHPDYLCIYYNLYDHLSTTDSLLGGRGGSSIKTPFYHQFSDLYQEGTQSPKH